MHAEVRVGVEDVGDAVRGAPLDLPGDALDAVEAVLPAEPALAPEAERTGEGAAAVRLDDGLEAHAPGRGHEVVEEPLDVWGRIDVEVPRLWALGLVPHAGAARRVAPCEAGDVGEIAARERTAKNLGERLLALAADRHIDERVRCKVRGGMVRHLRPAEDDQALGPAALHLSCDVQIQLLVPHRGGERGDGGSLVAREDRLGPVPMEEERHERVGVHQVGLRLGVGAEQARDDR